MVTVTLEYLKKFLQHERNVCDSLENTFSEYCKKKDDDQVKVFNFTEDVTDAIRKYVNVENYTGQNIDVASMTKELSEVIGKQNNKSVDVQLTGVKITDSDNLSKGNYKYGFIYSLAISNNTHIELTFTFDIEHTLNKDNGYNITLEKIQTQRERIQKLAQITELASEKNVEELEIDFSSVTCYIGE